MAFTDNAIVITPTPTEGDWKWASLYIADLSGAEDAIAAVSGKCIYIQKILTCGGSVTDLTVTYGAAQGTGVTTIYIGPIAFPDAGGVVDIDFGPDQCMKVAAGTAFSADASGAGIVTVLIKYKIAT
jgi:hypothetical protein